MITIPWWVLFVVAVTAGCIGAVLSLLWFALCIVSKWANDPARDMAELREQVTQPSEWVKATPIHPAYDTGPVYQTGTDYRELPY